MKPSLKQYADYFCMGLDLEICSRTELIAWADDLIGLSGKPEDWMIELATSQKQNILNVFHILRSIPGTANLDISFKLLLAKLMKEYPTVALEDIRILRKLYSFTDFEISYNFKACLYKIDSELDWLDSLDDDNWPVVQRDYENLLALGADYKDWVD